MKKLTVSDVASYILHKTSPLSAMKLQKLVYYSQAWSLVWDDKPLFDECIEAWANGPVAPSLYQLHRGKFSVSSGDITPMITTTPDSEQADTIDTVLGAYGDKSAQWLSEQTHAEQPWIQARKGLGELERGNNIITLESMSEYYSAL